MVLRYTLKNESMPSTKPNTDLLSPYVIETFERTDEELVKLSLSDSRHFAVLMEKYKPKFTNYLKEKKYNYNFPDRKSVV